MSLLSDFKGNTGIFRPTENLIDKAAFEALVEKYGHDVARGYLMAMLEVTQTVDGILFDNEMGNGAVEARSVVYAKLRNFHKAMFEFLNPEQCDLGHLNKPLSHHSKVQIF